MASAVMPLVFTQANATAAQSAVALVIDADAALVEIPMPWPGVIVGISVASEGARTAGTLTVQATVNGTVGGPTAVLDATNTQRKATAVLKDAGQAHIAGDRIGCKVTTDGAWAAGTTPSIAATVFVQRFSSET